VKQLFLHLPTDPPEKEKFGERCKFIETETRRGPTDYLYSESEAAHG
jgi:hypothetical protein